MAFFIPVLLLRFFFLIAIGGYLQIVERWALESDSQISRALVLPPSVSYDDTISSVQLLSQVLLFVTEWTVAHQASLSITNSRSLLTLMSIESAMPPDHFILCCPLLLQSFPASQSFPISQFFESGDKSIGPSASASVLPMKIQD